MSQNPSENAVFVRERCALLTPEGLAPTVLPGWERTECAVAISPALGARFALTLATLQHDGLCAGNTGAHSYFLYLLEGAASVLVEERRHRLEPGSYAFLPPGKDIELNSSARATRILVLQKPHRPLARAPKLAPLVGHERDARPQLLPGAEAIRIQPLLPAEPAYDLRLSLITLPPGAALPPKHPSAEGAFCLARGQGIFRLGGEWGLAKTGAVAWAAPFCPRWFAALGSAPASLLAYEDANRDPI